MLLRNNRRSFVCVCFATSFFLQSNVACFAGESAATVAALPGAEASRANVDYGELPIANDMLAVATDLEATGLVPSKATDTAPSAPLAQEDEKPDYVNDEPFEDKPDANKTGSDVRAKGAESESKGAALEASTDTKSGARGAKATKPLCRSNSNSEDTSEFTPAAIAQAFGDKVILRGDASIAPSEAARQIDVLTKQILLKEIELQRYSLHYTMEVAKQGRWKGWRYAFFQEINSGMGLAGSIISTSNRGQALHKSKRVDLHTQLAANYIPMIGSIIGASAAAGEFSINTYHEVMARSKGFSPSAAVHKVRGLQQDIDALLDKRDALMRIEASDPSLHEYVTVDEVEGRVLKDMRDQALSEFERFHISARKVLAFQQAQYLFDVAKYTTNAVGCDWAYLSLQNRHRIWNGRAGVMFAISGQLTCYAPILSRLLAKGYGEFTKAGMKDLSKEARETDMARLSADLNDLNRIIKEKHEHNPEVATTVLLQGDYESHERTFSNEIRSAQKKADAAKLTATQNIGAGLFVGGLKTASGVMFLVPGFNPNYNRSNERSSRVTNDLLFTSAILGLPAGVFSMLDTLRIQVRGEINRHKAAKEGKLPGQIAVARLKELDQMERKLKAI